MKIADRTFIVSGGSSGLGLATVVLLLSQNANVAIFDLNPPASSTSTLLLSKTRSHFCSTDVSSTDSLTSALTSTLTWIASTSKPLGGVICCAGIGSASRALPRQPENASLSNVKAMDMATFDRVLAINLRGTVDLIRLALPHMSLTEPEGDDDERGVIVVVSSVAAYEGQVGQLAYSASKGGVASIVLPLARELGQAAGIRVMGIAPGLFESGMTMRPRPVQKKEEGSRGKKSGGAASKAGFNPNMIEYPLRMGKGEEFARLVKEILENSMLNGQVLRLDGAIRMPARL